MSASVVIGGGRGFGLEAAKLLGLRGHKVFLADIDLDTLTAAQNLLTSMGLQSETRLIDARDMGAMGEFAATVMNAEQSVDSVVSLVGGSLGSPRWLSLVEPKHIQMVVELCVAPAWNAARAFRTSLVKSRGSLVFVSSSAARYGDRLGWSPVYAFGKGALLGLTRFLSCDPDWEGVRVTAVCPGDVGTERTGEIHSSGIMSDEEVAIVRDQRNMLRRMATPGEIGRAIVDMATNEFISGAILDVHGGEFPIPA